MNDLFVDKALKEIVLVFLGAILFQFCCYGQFSLRVFPMGVSGDPYADTLLNKRSVLLAAQVKQVNAYQTLAEVTKTFASKMVNLDRNGRIEKANFCMAERNESHFTLCIDDTIVYNTSGQIVHIKTADNRGIFMRLLFSIT